MPTNHRITGAIVPWRIPLVVGLVSIGIQWLDLDQSLQYQRGAVLDGFWWRLVTGHFVHLSWEHLVLNLAALAIIWELFYTRARTPRYLGEWLLLGLGVGLGLLAFSPAIQWYVGLSGILHGLLVRGALADSQWRWPAKTLLLVAVAAKLVYEQVFTAAGALLFGGDQVVVDAHLYGALTGTGLGIFAWLHSHPPAKTGN